MQISDENQAHFSIYRTEVGSYAIGDALTDDHLFELCRDHGDAFASLKFTVSHTSAAIHESQLDASYTQNFYTIPPPTVPTQSNDVYSLVRLQHHRGSPPRSLSSASERIPQEVGGGYDASVSSGEQLLPPGTSRFPFMEDNYTLPTRHTPQASPSDAARRREEEVQRLEGCLAELRWELEEQKMRAKEEEDMRKRMNECIAEMRSKEKSMWREMDEAVKKHRQELEELKRRAQEEANGLRECIAKMQSKLEEDRHGSGKTSVPYNFHHIPP